MVHSGFERKPAWNPELKPELPLTVQLLQGIANLAYSMGLLGIRHRDLLHAICGATLLCTSIFESFWEFNSSLKQNKLIIYRKVRNDWISCEMDLWKGWASSPALTASGHTTVQRALRVARCCVFLSGGHVNPRRLEDFSEQEVQQQEVLIAPQIACVFFDCLIDCFKRTFGHLKASRYPRDSSDQSKICRCPSSLTALHCFGGGIQAR